MWFRGIRGFGVNGALGTKGMYGDYEGKTAKIEGEYLTCSMLLEIQDVMGQCSEYREW